MTDDTMEFDDECSDQFAAALDTLIEVWILLEGLSESEFIAACAHSAKTYWPDVETAANVSDHVH